MVKVKFINADVLEGLKQLPDESVQCVVTSPPYWGLRDYGIEGQVWGGEEGCGHEWGNEIPQDSRHCYNKDNSGKKHTAADEHPKGRGSICRLCGAWKGSYGLEPTPELYIQHTVEIFREVRRVLRKDGILWLNLGDSYAGSWGDSGHRRGRTGISGHQREKNTETFERKGHPRANKPVTVSPPGLKPKDLCGIPWRVALALQADGWWLRSDIIWAKPNPMPESCTDRPTKAHEYIFLLTKSAKYYWDQEAVREESIWSSIPAKRYPSNAVNGSERPGGNRKLDTPNPHGRNLRSVWEIATAPFPQAHFATFPPAIPERCIKAGSKDGDIILDPLSGAGTTALVAAKLGRDAIGIELNPEYVEMSRKWITQELGFLADVEVICPNPR